MRILLVEDDPRIARFVSRGLREQTYAVDVACDGDDALYKAAVNDYDAVVLDVMIPGRDGFEVCRELRAAGSSVPVIMLTARDAVEDRVRGWDFPSPPGSPRRTAGASRSNAPTGRAALSSSPSRCERQK